MTEIQKGIFDLLLELDEICKKHDITYYLIGGSVLGAIRHNGFLPWDDDADIVMTKDNWEKLQKVFNTHMPKNRICVGWDNYSDEPSIFFRYVNTQQTDIHHSLWDHKMPWGCIVDIFVLNPLPLDPSQWDAYHKNMRRFGEYVMNASILMNSRSSLMAYLYDCICGKIKGPAYVKHTLYHKLSQYEESKCTHFSYLYPRIHLIYPKEIFQTPRYALFEGHMLPIPTLAEEHLRILFGDDWYNIPDDSNKIVHIAQHDTRRSYKEYMYDYLHYANTEQVRKRSLQVKVLKLLREKFRSPHARRMAKLRAHYLEQVFSNHFTSQHETLERLYQRQNYCALYQQFTAFYREQLTDLMQQHEIPIAIPQDVLFLALYAQIAAGYNRKARKIMDLHKGSPITHTSEWAEIEKLLKSKNDLFIAYETHDPSFDQMAQELFSTHPWDKDLRLMMLWSKLSKDDLTEMEMTQLLREAEEGTTQWPTADEFKKVQADIYLRLGNREAAYNLYHELKANTRNGMLLLQMQNELDWHGDTESIISEKEELDLVGRGSSI